MSDHPSWLVTQREFWTRRLEGVVDEITQGVEAELKQREEAHLKEVKQKDDENQMLAAHINELVIKNGKLVYENSILKQQNQRQDKCTSAVFSNATSPLSTPVQDDDKQSMAGIVSSEEYRHLIDKYNSLNELHRESAQKVRYLERKNAAIMQKNREMKDSVKAWHAYVEKKLPQSVSKSRSETLKHGTPDGRDTPVPPLGSSAAEAIKTSPSFTGMDRSSPAPVAPLLPSRISSVPHFNISAEPRDAVVSSPGKIPSEHHERDSSTGRPPGSISHDLTATILEQHTLNTSHPTGIPLVSSQVTDDEVVTQHEPKSANRATTSLEDDIPQIVSERSLKRKRQLPATVAALPDRIPSDGTPVNPFRIKEEQFSSPPPVFHQLSRKDTLDLDELGSNAITTPRRRRRRVAQVETYATLQEQRPTSVPLIKDEDHCEGENLQSDDTNYSAELSGDPEATAIARAHSEPTETPVCGDVLQPLDLNVHIKGSVEDGSNKRPRYGNARQRSKLDFLMESGEDISPMRRHNGKLGARAARANFNRKLLTRSAMGTTSHNAKSMKSDMKVQSLAPSNGPRVMEPPTSKPGLRKSPATESRSSSKAGAASVPWSGSKRVLQREPKEPALRSKPVTQLTLSDFRANPKFNHGYSYAFAETVRKRADRACLPGCTRAECCGSTFRTLATVAPALSFSQEEALLEEYLGDAYDSMNLTQMSADERRELVLQARTREMATKHGKHRQAYERHNTPPGYWRVDFPTTQESEEDAKKAREMERNQVEQRRIEAMRPGGRWIFRDEIIS